MNEREIYETQLRTEIKRSGQSIFDLDIYKMISLTSVDEYVNFHMALYDIGVHNIFNKNTLLNTNVD